VVRKVKNRRGNPRKKDSQEARSGWRFFIVVTLALTTLVFLTVAIGYVWHIDSTVVSKLEITRTARIPTLFAEPFTLNPGTSLPFKILKSELELRGYSETPLVPERPGEYFLVKSGSFTIFARESFSPNGLLIPAQRFELKFEKERVYLNPRSRPMVLEPLQFARLGQGDVRLAKYISLNQIPLHLQRAVLAIEDERFYSHHGVDLEGIARAMLINLRAMAWVQGGSTITQQLAKNVLLTPAKTIGRKLNEMAVAIALERRFSKDQILEWYLNEVYIGQEGSFAIHGVSEAAQTFFSKKLDEINIAEAALIAGIIQAPSAYAPRRHLDRAINRRNIVLLKMRENGFINETEEALARDTRPHITPPVEQRSKLAAHYVEAVKKTISDFVNLDSSQVGFNIFTSLHLPLQQCAENAVDQGLTELLQKKRVKAAIEAGLLVIEPHSGKIKAWVGGKDYALNQFDHVMQAKRQIGSTIKPFLYLTALDRSLNNYKVATASTVLPDQPMRFISDTQPTWEPENYDKKYRGDVTLRYALEHSLNLPAVYLADRVGLNNFATVIKNFRISDKPLAIPALALGATDTSLLALTAAYGALANSGNYVAPRLFISVVNQDGQVVAKQDLLEEAVANQDAVYVLTDILQGVVERGTAASLRRLGVTREVAGKTGTSNEARDGWFVGFSPNIVAGVWVGYDDNSVLGLTGAQAAIPIWSAFMKCADPFIEPLQFIPPNSVIFASVDTQSGGLATADCPSQDLVKELYIKETEPTLPCPLHSSITDNQKDTDIDANTPQDEERPGFWGRIFG
jgi:penicillin-binding protein 1B